ncbi:MFS general substrate transporter [Ganoderma sinense ZZ0214-1]|uniref:MFS general substrate transporter n=1 Tax=Ganoderma sinense ZZ0214-1 TaxID=1077348 RepID=A0A2G8SC22_9APHY|nr:MFS general substrate transporter [Ganoderma sinense ZZ0214-1]
MDSTRSGQVLALRTFSGLADNPHTSTTNGSAHSLNTGASESRPQEPSRTYQALLVFAGFMMLGHIIGINSIYGLFQEFYTSPETNIKDAQGQEALVSLVGTIGSGLTWSGCIFVNPIIPRANVKLITLIGAFIMSAGIILASFCDQLWQLFLTQGLLYGIGSSMYYFPLMSVIPTYFDRNRGAAMGIVVSGAGVGGLILSPVFHALLTRLGIRWSLRVLGLWNFAVSIPIASVLKKHGATGATGQSRVSMPIVKRGTFVLQACHLLLCPSVGMLSAIPSDEFGQSVGAFLQAAGNMVPNYYLTTYSVSVLSYSSSTGSLLLALNTAANTVARIGMGVLADRVGRQNTMVLSVIFSAVSVLALWYDSDPARFLAFIVFYGMLAGGYSALFPTTISEIYGIQNYASMNSAIYFVRGIGVLCGAPIAGIILGSHQSGDSNSNPSRSSQMLSIEALKTRYNDVAVFDGVLLLAAGLCVAYVRWLDARDKGGWLWRA